VSQLEAVGPDVGRIVRKRHLEVVDRDGRDAGSAQQRVDPGDPFIRHQPQPEPAADGLTLPAETVVRVWDSTAELRYLVLPMRPAGTGGWPEERLAELVGRDCMIGTAVPVVA